MSSLKKLCRDKGFGLKKLSGGTLLSKIYDSAARVIKHEVYRKEPFDFSEGSEDNGSREQINVILVCPAPLIISKVTGSTTAEIGNGDDACEGVLYTGEGFLNVLNRQ